MTTQPVRRSGPTQHATADGTELNPTADPIAWLVQDHRLVRDELERLTFGDVAARQATLDRLKALLSLHNAIEEALVYPAIANVAGRRNEAMQLFHQTAEADVLLDAVQRALLANDAAGYERGAHSLARALLLHVEEEEQHAFAFLDQSPPEEMMLLGERILAFRTTFGKSP